MPVPIWVLRNKFEPRGIRLKGKKQKPAPKIVGFVPGGIWDRYHHPGDAENSDVRRAMALYDERKRKERAQWRVPHVSGVDVAGNLTGTEYQYWIGSPFAERPLATCRWCGYNAFSKEERDKHKYDHVALRENDSNKSCAKMLQESFAILSKGTTRCIFCGKA